MKKWPIAVAGVLLVGAVYGAIRGSDDPDTTQSPTTTTTTTRPPATTTTTTTQTMTVSQQQAVRKAESYLKYSAFSRSGLIEQLEFEGFTPEQAAYGASENGL